MKKLTGIVLVLVAALVPALTVLAITGNYFVYKEGDIVNFYYNDDDAALGEVSEEAGRATIIIDDEGADSQFVKVLLFGLITGGPDNQALTYKDGVNGFVGRDENDANAPINVVLSKMNEQHYQDGYVKDKSVWGNVGFITVEELVKAFKAVKDGTDANGNDTYKIDPETKIGTKGMTIRQIFNAEMGDGSFIEQLFKAQAQTELGIEAMGNADQVAKLGFYTSTATEDGKIYAVDITLNADEDIDKIVVKAVEVPNESATTHEYYSLVPTAYFDKTYDCTNRKPEEPEEPTVTSSCYLCDDEYVWTEDGTQKEGCKVVTKIKRESDCVKPVQTGVEEYLPELIAILALGGLSIVLLKKKDFFKSI